MFYEPVSLLLISGHRHDMIRYGSDDANSEERESQRQIWRSFFRKWLDSGKSGEFPAYNSSLTNDELMDIFIEEADKGNPYMLGMQREGKQPDGSWHVERVFTAEG